MDISHSMVCDMQGGVAWFVLLNGVTHLAFVCSRS
jgi:hypothetical protein